jgi:DnaJ-class molecular chaperone
MNDTEAYWRGWQITRTRGGLARSYRDPRFDTLAECARCRGTGVNGAGVNTDLPCAPCLGTGRITLGEVS